MQGDARVIVAIAGSIAILCWPILVMLVRSALEARRWRNILMARAWIGSWFTGSGIWITAAWITAILLIRVITSALFSGTSNSEILAWILVLAAMAVAAPFAWRAPREQRLEE